MAFEKSLVLATLSQNYPNNNENDDCSEAAATELFCPIACD